MNDKMILVTGCSGFVGSRLVENLLSDGYQVLGISRTTGFLSQDILKNKSFKFISHDFSKGKLSLPKIVGVFHLLSQQSLYEQKEIEGFYPANVHAVSNVQQSLSFPPEYFVFLSSIAVYSINDWWIKNHNILSENIFPNPTGEYGITKLLGETIGRELFFGLNTKYIVIRVPSLFGKNHLGGIIYTYYKTLAEHKELEIYHQGTQKRYLLYIDDVIECLRAIDRNYHELENYELFHYVSDDSKNSLEIASFMKKCLKSHSDIVTVGEAQSNSFIIPNIKIKSALGISPISMESGLKKYIDDMSR